MTDTEFARRFGEAYQYTWVYGDGSVDLGALGAGLSAMLAEQAAAAGFDISTDHDGEMFQYFRPLIQRGEHDAMLILERYPDLMVWAGGECLAQRTPGWMQWVLGQLDDPHTWLGDGSIMIDDAKSTPVALSGPVVAMDWITIDAGKKAALVDIPELAQDLTEAIAAEGYTETSVRCFGMTTIAGPWLNHGHILLEHSSVQAMSEVLAWRQSSPKLGAWRQKIRDLAGDKVQHELFVKIG